MTEKPNKPRAGGACLTQPVRRIALTEDEAYMLLSAWGQAGEEHHDDCPSLKAKMGRLRKWLDAPNARGAGARENNEPNETDGHSTK